MRLQADGQAGGDPALSRRAGRSILDYVEARTLHAEMHCSDLEAYAEAQQDIDRALKVNPTSAERHTCGRGGDQVSHARSGRLLERWFGSARWR